MKDWIGIPARHTDRTRARLARGLLRVVASLMLVGWTEWATPAGAQTRSTVEIDRGIVLPYGPPWVLDMSAPRDSVVLDLVPPDTRGGIEARVVCTTEHRRSHGEALHRVEQIAHNRRHTRNRYYTLGGWPAAERRYQAELEAPVDAAATSGAQTDEASRVSIAVAADAVVLRCEGTVLPGADPSVGDQIATLIRGVQFFASGNPTTSQRDLHVIITPPRDSFVPPPLNFPILEARPSGDRSTPLNLLGDVSGELAVAVQPNGQFVVVATQNRWFTSFDSGKTFTTKGSVPFTWKAQGDPALSVGASGAFYLTYLGLPNGTPAALNKTGCAVEMSTSPNGANFAFVSHAVFCPNTGSTCFPDQEQIAADPVNQVNGNDEVYVVFRNFTGSGPCGSIKAIPDPGIGCSLDGGVNWTAPVTAGSGDFARVSVAPDGFVYVVYQDGDSVMVNKFSSCGAGLLPQPGFPVEVVDDVGEIACPLPGIDRCEEDLAAPSLAADPNFPSHLTVAYLSNTSGTNDDVLSQDSWDGGLSWSPPLIVNAGVNARRFMPWICGDKIGTFVGWYDRRAATPQQDDLTDYFVGVAADYTFRADGLGPEFLMSTNSDPQCQSGWGVPTGNPPSPVAPRSKDDAESCSIQPQLAGQCSGSLNTRCDFSDGCPAGLGSCQIGNGIPKYGDYNGFACANGRIFAAWASATAEGGISPSGIQVFSAALTPPTLAVDEFVTVVGGGPYSGPEAFVLTIDGQPRALNLGASGGISHALLAPGLHAVGEATSVSLPPFTRTITGDCAPDGTVQLAFGDEKSCTIENTFTVSAACAADCKAQRDECLAMVDPSDPSAPTTAECVQEYKGCLAGC